MYTQSASPWGRPTVTERRRAWFALIALFVGLISPRAVTAHPSVSVVMNRAGDVFFSDLYRIWAIRADGGLAVVLGGVHAHELWLDDEGAVLGEDVANVGEIYRHRVFKIDPDGSVSWVVPWRPGYPREDPAYATTREAGGPGWALGLGGVVRRFDAQGRRLGDNVRVPRPVRWITSHPSGALVTREHDILMLSPRGEHLFRIRPDLTRTEAFDWVGDHHTIMKPWVGLGGDIYVPVYGGQRIERFDANGQLRETLPTPPGWSPTGGLVDAQGAQWVLEWEESGQRCRVRLTGRGERDEVFDPSAR